MENSQDTFGTRKRSFIGAFLMCMTVPFKTTNYILKYLEKTQTAEPFLTSTQSIQNR